VMMTQDAERAPQSEDMPQPDAASCEATITSPADATGNHSNDDWKTKYDTLYDQYVRLLADFDNFRKRRVQELESARKYDGQYAMTNLLPAIDNFKRAMAYMSESSDPKALFQTLNLMHQQLMSSLEQCGLKSIATKGEKFNPALHEAVGSYASAGVDPDTILEETLAGYQLHDRLIRAAQVIVASTATEQPDTDAAQGGQESSAATGS
jgi:molecular chaperone GrpE